LECGGPTPLWICLANHEVDSIQSAVAAKLCRRTPNIRIQPLTGDVPTQLTHWSANPIFSFDWSRDGKFLAYASGSLTSDVILISDAGN
jgi:hypothetical protein